MKKIILLLLSAIIFSACSSEKSPQSGQGAPGSTGQAAPEQATTTPGPAGEPGQYQLILNPPDANVTTTLYLGARGFNPADAKIEWLVNSALPYPGENSAMLKGGIAKKGFTVQAKATIKGTEVRSNSITIKNVPPELSGKIKILPEVFKPGDMLSVEPSATDPDGDDVIFQYEWTKNGEPAGKTGKIESAIKRGDKVSVKITPCDREACGSPYTLNTTIGNMPPQIDTTQKPVLQGDTYTVQFRATDPDGGPIAYALKNPPTGMTINPSTGLITWTVQRDFRGKGSYTAVAKDSHGGEATQVFNYDIGP